MQQGTSDLKYDLDASGAFSRADVDLLLIAYDKSCIPIAPPTTPPPTTPPPPKTPPSNDAPTFVDISNDVHRQSVLAVAKEGIAAGFSDGTYRPGLAVTRGQMATFLARALHLSLSNGGPMFSDLAGEIHGAAIRAIAARGITGGFGDGTFRAGLPVNRQQMASFLARAFDLPASAGNPFSDISGVHAASIAAVADAGVADGFGDGTYRPALAVTRGQMATFLARALDL